MKSIANELSIQKTACLRCRKQKLKCSKELPICKRCSTLNRSCSYPPPADRRKPVTQHGTHTTASKGGPLSPTGFSLPSLNSVLRNDGNADSSRGLGPEDRSYNSHIPLPNTRLYLSGEGTSPSSSHSESQLFQRKLQPGPEHNHEVAMFLVEVYFSRAYNAPLLFHKPRFLLDWPHMVPEFVSLSMFALASIFLHRKNDQDAEYSGALPLNSIDWQKQGAEWASLASQKVLAQADTPYMATVQACQNLVLYWFSRAQTERANFHAMVGYRTCRLLGYHRNDDDRVVDDVTAELRRRCLWSCWMTQCISQENAAFPGGCWAEVAGTLLPSDDTSFTNGCPSVGEYIDQHGAVHINTEGTPRSQAVSYAAEFAKLTGMWWEIQRSVKHFVVRTSEETAQQLAALFNLSRKLEELHENLPAELRFSNVATSKTTQDHERIFALNCLYHLCVTSLHASVVPIFSISVNVSDIPRNVVQASAQETVKHSYIVLSMASAFLDLVPDVSKVPSITGFCMFVCISIQHKYMVNQRASRPLYDSFKPALSILNILKEYWMPLQPLAEQLERQLNQEGRSSTDTALNHASDVSIRTSGKGSSVMERSDSFPDVITFVPNEDSRVRRPTPASEATPDDGTGYYPQPVSDNATHSSINEAITPASGHSQAQRSPAQGHAENTMDVPRAGRFDFGTRFPDVWWDQVFCASEGDSTAIFENPFLNLS